MEIAQNSEESSSPKKLIYHKNHFIAKRKVAAEMSTVVCCTAFHIQQVILSLFTDETFGQLTHSRLHDARQL
ncbi:unnamed protein product [Ixodes persulcatus]